MPGRHAPAPIYFHDILFLRLDNGRYLAVRLERIFAACGAAGVSPARRFSGACRPRLEDAGHKRVLNTAN
ncbi:MAG: hypothetical protein ABSE63_12955 [Thermoguttaceae bacterium]